MTRRSLPSFSATMSKRQMLAALKDLAAEVTRLSSASVAAPLVKRGEQIAVNDTQWRRIPARLTSVATVSGQNRYGFKEQIYSSTTGVYADNIFGLIGDGVNLYATELNNTLLVVPTSAPFLYTWLRYKGQVGIAPVYEFYIQPPANSSTGLTPVQVTSWVPQVLSGGSFLVLPGVTGTYAAGPQFTSTGTVCWLWNPNGYTPTNGDWFLAQFVGNDGSGTPIYAATSPSPVWIKATSATAQTVSIGGVSTTAFAGTVFVPAQPQGQGGLVTASQTAWIVPVNTSHVVLGAAVQVPPVRIGSYYPGYFCGFDGSNVPGYFTDQALLYSAPVPQYFTWTGTTLNSVGSPISSTLQTLTLAAIPPIFRNAANSFWPVFEVKGSIRVTITGAAGAVTTVTVNLNVTGAAGGATQAESVSGAVTVPVSAPASLFSIPVYGIVDQQGATGSCTVALQVILNGPSGASAVIQAGPGALTTSPFAQTGMVTVIPIATQL